MNMQLDVENAPRIASGLPLAGGLRDLVVDSKRIDASETADQVERIGC